LPFLQRWVCWVLFDDMRSIKCTHCKNGKERDQRRRWVRWVLLDYVRSMMA